MPVVQEYLDSCKTGMAESQMNFANEDLMSIRMDLPPLEEQEQIANYLQKQARKVDEALATSSRLVDLSTERINGRVAQLIGESVLTAHGTEPVVEMRRLIERVVRPASAADDTITAFRDGQVTARRLRREDGFTDPTTSDSYGQGVEVGDVVVHGLDGFSGAIGDSEVAGKCSPVYHVCAPIDGGSGIFYGRLLRLLALDGYLELFATSTRERAVDFRNWGRFGRIPIPKVPPRDQISVAAQILASRPFREQVADFQGRLLERRRAVAVSVLEGWVQAVCARGVDV